jgi:hypothetical protein
MLVHVGLNLVVEIFHDALERFGERFVGDSGVPSSCWTRSRSLWTSTRVRSWTFPDPWASDIVADLSGKAARVRGFLSS